jgi:hypothetical protein
MDTIESIFEHVKFLKFLESFTDINPTGGIRHRITGKGTNKIDKIKGLTDADKAAIKEGLIKFVAAVQNVIDKT